MTRDDDCNCPACQLERDQITFRAGAIVGSQFVIERALEAFEEQGTDGVLEFLRSARAAYRANSLAEAEMASELRVSGSSSTRSTSVCSTRRSSPASRRRSSDSPSK